MATVISHVIAAGFFYKLFTKKKNYKVLFLCLLASVFPDFDVISFKLGIPYEHMLGHRGFTHSILFAVLFALTCLLAFLKENASEKIKLFFLFFIAMMSHGFLDMLTNGGLGVGLFIPFSSERFFFPITPIEVSPIGRNFFSMRGVAVVINEFKLIVLPILGLSVILFCIKGPLKRLKWKLILDATFIFEVIIIYINIIHWKLDFTCGQWSNVHNIISVLSEG